MPKIQLWIFILCDSFKVYFYTTYIFPFISFSLSLLSFLKFYLNAVVLNSTFPLFLSFFFNLISQSSLLCSCTRISSVVYFDQLSGAARTWKLVKTAFLPFSTFFHLCKLFSMNFGMKSRKNIWKNCVFSYSLKLVDMLLEGVNIIADCAPQGVD